MSGTTISTSSWLAVTSMSSARASSRPSIGIGNARLQRAGAVVGQRERDRLAQLGDADRRDEHDDAGRLEQPADHRELDDRARERADEERERSATASTASRALPAMTASSAAAGTPRSPTAKLMTRLER